MDDHTFHTRTCASWHWQGDDPVRSIGTWLIDNQYVISKRAGELCEEIIRRATATGADLKRHVKKSSELLLVVDIRDCDFELSESGLRTAWKFSAIAPIDTVLFQRVAICANPTWAVFFQALKSLAPWAGQRFSIVETWQEGLDELKQWQAQNSPLPYLQRSSTHRRKSTDVLELLQNHSTSLASASIASKLKMRIDNNPAAPVEIKDFCQQENIGRSRLWELFRREYRVSPKQYHILKRIELSRMMLLSTNLSITTIALRAGFTDSAHFSKLFKKHHGQSPSQFRKKLSTST